MGNECRLCPRGCGADREHEKGFCGTGRNIRIARAAEHYWEEPCISGERGAGNVFFSGCPLGCCFCQNSAISREGLGRDVSEEQLAEIFLRLQDRGVHNINLVTPTHFAPQIERALSMAKARGMNLPVVYNCGGYESPESLAYMEGLVDVYLPDLKFFSPELSRRYCNAPDYFEVAYRAITIMLAQVGTPVFDGDMLVKGVMVRHMILPGCRKDSLRVLEELAKLGPENILLSLMRQYTPCYRSHDYPEINRRLTAFEYDTVARRAEDLGFVHGYLQEKDSAKQEYVPPFEELEM